MDLNANALEQFRNARSQSGLEMLNRSQAAKHESPAASFGQTLNHSIASSSHASIAEEVRSNPEKKKLYEASQDFQAIFLGQMLSAMRKNLHKDNDLLFGGRTQEIFEDFLYDEYAKMMSKQPGFTLADEIYKQLSGG